MQKKNFNILIVDDEKDYCEVMEIIFSVNGYLVDTCYDGITALIKMQESHFDLVLTDLMMPDMDGSQLLIKIKALYPSTEVIIMTAYGTIEKAVDTMKRGAYTYITKGDNPEGLLAEVAGLQSLKGIGNLTEETETLSILNSINSKYMLNSNSPLFQRTLAMAEKAAKSNANILILGESGSGKEVIARYIHEKSNRKGNFFMNLNCHSIPETVLESELFGHEKGSFTGAFEKRIGRFEAADHGTLFLDEIGDIPSSMQAKLLNVLESKVINRVGNNTEINVHFRLLTATNKDLNLEINQERFREDLFYRLSTIIIQLPPLRARKEDLPLLINHFLEESKREMGIHNLVISPLIFDTLLTYNYPGNIRELKSIIDRMVIFSENGIIQGEESPFLSPTTSEAALSIEGKYVTKDYSTSEKTLRELRKELESKYIVNILKNYNNDMNKASEVLGITRRQLLNKITEYGLKEEKNFGNAFSKEKNFV